MDSQPWLSAKGCQSRESAVFWGNIETTQIYAKITVEKLDNDLTMLGDKLSKSFGNIKVAGI